MTSATTTERLAALNHRHVTSSVSTNSELIDALQSGTISADDRQLLTAETQTAGRGQHTRSWQSPAGNVYLSLYHPIDIPVSGLLSLIIGLELAKMPIIQRINQHLKAQGKTPIGVKWANDLGFYQPQMQNTKCTDSPINEKSVIAFSKLAGILIEPVLLAGKLTGIVIGVGLNVTATPKLTEETLEGMSYQAISLQDICASLMQAQNSHKLENLPTLAVIYQQISQALLAAVDCFNSLATENSKRQASTIDPVMSQFHQQFQELDALKGLMIKVTQSYNKEERVIEGHACGIDTNGCLQLQQDNGSISAIFTGRIDVISAS